jgi:hypothetical protein
MDLKDQMKNNKAFIVFILLAIILGIFLNWGNIEILIFAIFIGIIIKPVSSRYLAIPALFFLALTPFLLIADREERAEEFAIYAYYFLIMAVIMGVYEVTRENRKKIEEKNLN